jgi:hypothetical protein
LVAGWLGRPRSSTIGYQDDYIRAMLLLCVLQQDTEVCAAATHELKVVRDVGDRDVLADRCVAGYYWHFAKGLETLLDYTNGLSKTFRSHRAA